MLLDQFWTVEYLHLPPFLTIISTTAACNDSLEYRDKVYRGIIQAAGKDHIVISDTRDGKRYILLLVYLDYVEFDEPINYEYPIR